MDSKIRSSIELKEIRSFQEKRKSPRKPFIAPIDYVTEYGTGRVLCRNISKGGIFFETSDFKSQLQVGQDILINIPSKDRKKLIKIMGGVVRTDPTGVGVKFQKMFKM